MTVRLHEKYKKEITNTLKEKFPRPRLKKTKRKNLWLNVLPKKWLKILILRKIYPWQLEEKWVLPRGVLQ